MEDSKSKGQLKHGLGYTKTPPASRQGAAYVEQNNKGEGGEDRKMS